MYILLPNTLIFFIFSSNSSKRQLNKGHAFRLVHFCGAVDAAEVFRKKKVMKCFNAESTTQKPHKEPHVALSPGSLWYLAVILVMTTLTTRCYERKRNDIPFTIPVCEGIQTKNSVKYVEDWWICRLRTMKEIITDFNQYAEDMHGGLYTKIVGRLCPKNIIDRFWCHGATIQAFGVNTTATGHEKRTIIWENRPKIDQTSYEQSQESKKID